MRRWLLTRLAQAAVIAIVAVTLTFVLVKLAPGDPFASALENPNVSAAVRLQWRASYGLDRPLGEQYLRWLGNVARGDLGYSVSLGQPVRDALGDAIPNTLLLTGVSLAAGFALGIAMGLVQAGRRGSRSGDAADAVTLVVYSMPDFWLALIVLLAFAYWVPLFPAGGMVDPILHDRLGPWGRARDVLVHLALPAFTLTLLTAASVARFQRAALLEASTHDYVRTARAKGLGEGAVLRRHVLRNSLLPALTLIGLSLPALLGGAVFVETVFAWPGMGSLAVRAIGERDYPLVAGAVLAGALLVTLGSLIADLLYAVADPRLRTG